MERFERHLIWPTNEFNPRYDASKWNNICFQLTKTNGDTLKFRGIEVFAIGLLRDELKKDNNQRDQNDPLKLTENDIKQFYTSAFRETFFNKLKNIGYNESFPLKHPRTKELIYTITKLDARYQDHLIFNDSFTTPEQEEEEVQRRTRAYQEALRQRAERREARRRRQAQPAVENEDPTVEDDEPTAPVNENPAQQQRQTRSQTKEKDPSLPGGKKKKARKYTQRRKRNGSSKIRRHKTRRVF
jgi:vacuolar-type H+-ATPase subunit I/STV1